jgi:uncharacterized protein
MASLMRREDRKLIVAIHDVCPATLEACRGLTTLVEQCLPDVPLTLLIIPDYRGQHRIDQAQEFRSWVDGRIERGDEVVLHGLRHFDDGPPPRTPSAWIRRRMLTDGEAEFATLSAGQARRSIARGLELMLGCGWNVEGFVPPAWQISATARATLSEFGFRYTSGRSALYGLPDWTSWRTPTLAFSSWTAWRRWASVRWARMTAENLADWPVVRVAMHPADHNFTQLDDCWRKLLVQLAEHRDVITKREAMLGG